ncbi:MAG: cyclic nucleotide-gated ion channel [Hyphomicrobiales bacterium]
MARNDDRYSALKRRLFDVLEDGAPNSVGAHVVNYFLVGLILVNVAAVILETVPELAASHSTTFHIIDTVSVLIFSVEYLARLWVADLHAPLRQVGPLRSRLSYAAQPASLVDLAAILPFYLQVFGSPIDLRFLRLFRLVRFLKLTRYSPGMRSLFNAIATERRALGGGVIIMVGMVLTAAAILHIVEGEAQPEAFGSIPEAMWWAVATLTTVGYGDVVPITPLGKLIGAFVMMFGFGMFAVPVGIVATAFAREIHQREFVVTWGMVARVPLFANLSASEIAEVMKLLHAQTFAPGQIIAHAGDPAHSMYFIAIGDVQIMLPDKMVELSEGAFFGEMAVLRKARRSATIIATSRCNLLVLDAGDLQAMFHRRPEIAERIRMVAIKRMGEEIVTPGGDLASEELSPKSDS